MSSEKIIIIYYVTRGGWRFDKAAHEIRILSMVHISVSCGLLIRLMGNVE
jgi:hypothetical protein